MTTWASTVMAEGGLWRVLVHNQQESRHTRVRGDSEGHQLGPEDTVFKQFQTALTCNPRLRQGDQSFEV